MLYFCGAVCCAVSLRVGTPFPLALLTLPKLSPLIFFKILGVKLLIVRICQITPLCFFKAKYYGDLSSPCKFSVPGVSGMKVCSPPLSISIASLSPADSLKGPFSSQLCLCLSYSLQCGLFSTFSCGESVLEGFGLFSGLFTVMWMLCICICGMI